MLNVLRSYTLRHHFQPTKSCTPSYELGTRTFVMAKRPNRETLSPSEVRNVPKFTYTALTGFHGVVLMKQGKIYLDGI